MMETKTYTTIDRAALGWPAGPWDDEPDKVQWPDPATGLPCLAVRHKRSGHWCGYVGLARDAHPLHGKDYGEAEVGVHGGLTFADACNPSEAESQGICHTPAPGEPDHVWFGFDCAHAGDYSPADLKRSEQGYPFTIMDDEQYRTLAYVQNECARLAGQLVKPNVGGNVRLPCET
jgi:hypothetical protein